MNLKELIFGGAVTGVSDRSGAYEGSAQAWIPVKDIINGVVVTRDKRFIKILELLPVNFYTMSDLERSSAIADFGAYLKIAPSNLQINVLTQKFDLDSYLKMLRERVEREENEQCQEMIRESMEYVPQLVEREAITHRFFLSFAYDPSMKASDNTPQAIAALLNEKGEVARRYLDRCGVSVLEPEYTDNFVLELLYQLINKHTSQHIKLPEGAFDMLGMIHGVYDESSLLEWKDQAAEPQDKKKKWKLPFRKKAAPGLSDLEAGATTIPDLISPTSIDSRSSDYLLLDGVYHAYLYITGYGYATVAGKGWLTPLIEAGEGVSMSFQLRKQPRDKTLSSISQTTMVNRSRMRDVGDTRQDFEELGDAISAGMFLKEGMNREGEDFYYMHTLIEVVADDPDTLEQRVSSVETLCVASDMLAKRCEFKHEQAFLSFLPLLILDPDIERKSRRNALTNSVAAAFPFASYELSDPRGIFLGLNLYNRSPVFIDLFDDYRYTNGNFAAFGSSGAGKSTILQSVGKRLREQGRKVICIVPEKGHEYRPLCQALGGQFIKLGPSSQDCIGLMEIRRFQADPYHAGRGAGRDSLMAEKVSWLSVWYSLQKKNLSEEDRAYIDASLIECYNRRGITFDNRSIFEEDGVTPKEMPVIKDWYDVLMARPETRHLAVVLTRYVSGSAATMGGHTNIDTNNSYIVIDLTDLPDDLMLASIYAATGFATDIIVQNGDVGTGLLSDELWKLLGANSNPLAADYTMRMVKLIRSQGGVAGVTSQGMADMMALEGGKYGKAILDSCRIKILMQMEEQEARLAQEKLNLTDEEVRMITRFRRGEGLLCIGHNHVPVAVHVSPKEYEAITTSPTDLRARLNRES